MLCAEWWWVFEKLRPTMLDAAIKNTQLIKIAICSQTLAPLSIFPANLHQLKYLSTKKSLLEKL